MRPTSESRSTVSAAPFGPATSASHGDPPNGRLPPWLRVELPIAGACRSFGQTGSTVANGRLHTVCQEARCPNLRDCWGRGTATFMVGGKACTRACRFCAVSTLRQPPPPDPAEPQRLACAVAEMQLDHAVITVVNRDDLDDGGAGHFRSCLEAVRNHAPHVTLELLSSDLAGSLAALEQLVVQAPLEVFAHNVECVERLDRSVRDPRASFSQSLHMLEQAKKFAPRLLTKSSLMVGVGESDVEVSAALHRLHDAGVDIVTIGQYLAPSFRHLRVDRFVPPARFAAWQAEALEIGFCAAAAGPLVRSSYRAGSLYRQAQGISTRCVSSSIV